ncbi:unnamed protein product [Penicillium glandicola]
MRNPQTDIDIQNFISYQLRNSPKLQQWKSRHEEIQEKLTNKAQECKSDIEPFIWKLFQDQSGSFATWIRLHDIDCHQGFISNFERAIEDIPSPLYYAVLLGLESILDTLMTIWDQKTTKDALNTQAGSLGTALQAASSGLSGRAFNDACYEKVVNEKVVQILIDHGADVNARAQFGTVLQTASISGHEKVVQILIDHGADVNARGYYGNALQAAILEGRTKVVQILLDHDADVNAPEGPYGTALQAAAMHGCTKVVQILLDHSADVNAPEGPHSTALQAAALYGRTKVVHILLDHSADVNAPGHRYGTALQAAALEGHTKIVQILLDHSADANAPGGIYDTPLQAAIDRGHGEVVQILLDNGAEVRPMI